MSSPVVIMSQSLGLHPRQDPGRLFYDPETGRTELSQAVNVVVDDSGRVERAPGFAKLGVLNNAHSLFATSNNELLAVTSAGLCKLFVDGTSHVLWAGLAATERMYYVELPEAVYLSNGVDRLMYKNGVVSEWQESVYVGDRQTSQTILDGDALSLASYRAGLATERERERLALTRPPAGKHLAAYNNRIYFASGKFLHYTESTWRCWYAPAENWRAFEDAITLIAPVDDGIYVGVASCLYFLSGADPDEFSLRLVWTSPVNADAYCSCNAMDVGLGDGRQNGKAHLALARNELLLLGRSGQVVNLLEAKMQPITASRGALAIIGGKLVALLE